MVGFLSGQIFAMLLDLAGVQITHFPGGLSALGQVSSPPWWSNAVGLVGLWSGFAGAIWFAATSGGLDFPPRFWRVRPGDVGFVALGVACQVIIDAAYAPFHLRTLNKPVGHLFNAAHGVTFWLLIVMTTIGAPIMEEWLFRGVVYRALSEGTFGGRSRQSVIVATLVSAVLFALAHAEPLQFVGLLFLGIVLAQVLERTQRLVPSIVTHISFNTVAVISLIVHRTGH